MDAEGARALARRIAKEEAKRAGGPEPKRPRPAPQPLEDRRETMYVRPIATREPRAVRIYIQGEDGRLRPAEL